MTDKVCPLLDSETRQQIASQSYWRLGSPPSLIPCVFEKGDLRIYVDAPDAPDAQCYAVLFHACLF